MRFFIPISININARDEMLIRHGEAVRACRGHLGLLRDFLKSWIATPAHGGLAMTSLEKASKLQDALKVFEIGITSSSRALEEGVATQES